MAFPSNLFKIFRDLERKREFLQGSGSIRILRMLASTGAWRFLDRSVAPVSHWMGVRFFMISMKIVFFR